MGNPKRLVNTRNCARNEKFACLDTRIVFWLTQSPIAAFLQLNKQGRQLYAACLVYFVARALRALHATTYCFTTFTTFETPFAAEKRTK